ncbi:hypothetical protein B9Z19DRAFT_568966 [Tuber borchii]|uniref:Uncharacterized protein n=1 Tax=Tuber borchii TaxID=42251 RepID=A0A2T6ZCG1_TUBBO|nr:hypothetical protein B9Z19DRAFT_568966 [Tuber borchii]
MEGRLDYLGGVFLVGRFSSTGMEMELRTVMVSTGISAHSGSGGRTPLSCAHRMASKCRLFRRHNPSTPPKIKPPKNPPFTPPPFHSALEFPRFVTFYGLLISSKETKKDEHESRGVTRFSFWDLRPGRMGKLVLVSTLGGRGGLSCGVGWCALWREYGKRPITFVDGGRSCAFTRSEPFLTSVLPLAITSNPEHCTQGQAE